MVNSFSIFANKQFQSLTISHFSTVLGQNLFLPILPVFLQLKGFSETKIGFIMGVTAASALFIRPLVGVKVDSKGSRPVILVGQLLFLLSIAGYLAATSFIEFFSLRLLFGIALAFYGTGAVTFASSIGTGENNASAIAMYTLVTMLGLGLSMGISQIAFDALGFDTTIVGSLLLISIAFGVMNWRTRPINPSGGGARASFVTVLESPAVIGVTTSQFATSFAFSAVFTFIPLAALANDIHFYSLFFIAFAVLVVASRFFVQDINTRFGLKRTVLYASVIMVISILLLIITINPTILILSGSLFGLGFGVVFPTLVLLVIGNIDRGSRGTALSILTASGDIGAALSTAILGGVAEHFGYTYLFLASALIVVISTYYFNKNLAKGSTNRTKYEKSTIL
jgi:predicted MFS family arabinose efflux permease